MRPADVPALQRVVYQQFPTVTVVNIADVMQIVEDVVQRIAMVIRFISAFTVLAGAVMVASSVAGTRFRRMREVVTLKTLGATRRRIAWIFSVEFLALGVVAGLMGTALASGFAALVLKKLLEVEFHPSLLTHALAVAIAAAVATAAGWAASFRIWGESRWRSFARSEAMAPVASGHFEAGDFFQARVSVTPPAPHTRRLVRRRLLASHRPRSSSLHPVYRQRGGPAY